MGDARENRIYLGYHGPDDMILNKIENGGLSTLPPLVI
jgi:hypothetical protein